MYVYNATDIGWTISILGAFSFFLYTYLCLNRTDLLQQSMWQNVPFILQIMCIHLTYIYEIVTIGF